MPDDRTFYSAAPVPVNDGDTHNGFMVRRAVTPDARIHFDVDDFSAGIRGARVGSRTTIQLSQADALNLAAWIIALSSMNDPAPGMRRFAELLDAVRSSKTA